MDKSSEFYVQIFLFVATILCYVVLALFVFYGIYYCCLRACILRTKRKRRDDEQQEAETEAENWGYCRRVKLLNPFHRDEKNAIIVEKNISKHTTLNSIDIQDNNISDSSITLNERNPFVDKKYYDIFVA